MIKTMCEQPRIKNALTERERQIFNYLSAVADSGVIRDVSNAMLAVELDIPTSSVKVATDRLARKGYIKKEPDFHPHGGQSGHKYTITKRSKRYKHK